MQPHVTEPMTMLTDYILAVQSSVYAWMLARRSGAPLATTVRLWVGGLCFAAVGAVAGGSAHGFRLYIPDLPLTVLWTVTILGVGLGAVVLSWAGIQSALRPQSITTRDRIVGARWLRVALVSAIAGSSIVIFRISPHPFFNQNDLAHVVFMAGLYAVYRSVVLRHPSRSPRSS